MPPARFHYRLILFDAATVSPRLRRYLRLVAHVCHHVITPLCSFYHEPAIDCRLFDVALLTPALRMTVDVIDLRSGARLRRACLMPRCLF